MEVKNQYCLESLKFGHFKLCTVLLLLRVATLMFWISKTLVFDNFVSCVQILVILNR